MYQALEAAKPSSIKHLIDSMGPLHQWMDWGRPTQIPSPVAMSPCAWPTPNLPLVDPAEERQHLVQCWADSVSWEYVLSHTCRLTYTDSLDIGWSTPVDNDWFRKDEDIVEHSFMPLWEVMKASHRQVKDRIDMFFDHMYEEWEAIDAGPIPNPPFPWLTEPITSLSDLSDDDYLT